MLDALSCHHHRPRPGRAGGRTGAGAGDPLRFQRRPPADAARHLRGRSRRRGPELEGPDLRLHAHRPSLRHARRQPHVRAQRLAAVRVRSRPANSRRELGQQVYGFNAAIGLRVDPQDNVWVIDQAANQVIKFDPAGNVALVLGRKPEAIQVRPARPPTPVRRPVVAAAAAAARLPFPAEPVPPPPPGLPAPATPARRSSVRPTWPGTRPATSTSPTASAPTTAWRSTRRTAGSSRQWGSTGSENGQFKGVKSLAIDAQGNVYVADFGNKRIQVFDGDGNYKSRVRRTSARR